MNAERAGPVIAPRPSVGAVGLAMLMAFVMGVSGCVSNYRVAPLPEPAPAVADATAVALGDLVVVHRRDGTTVTGQVIALDEEGLALQPRRSSAPPLRIARADIVEVERFELARLATNIVVVSAVVVGVVMILMAAPNLGVPGI